MGNAPVEINIEVCTVIRPDFTAIEGACLELERLTASAPKPLVKIVAKLFDSLARRNKTFDVFDLVIASASGADELWVIGKPTKRLRCLVTALRAANGLLAVLRIGRHRVGA